MCAEQAGPGRPDYFPALIAATLPDATIETDRPLHDGGEWWFDIRQDSQHIPVSWHPQRGFGLTLDQPGYGERPAELYSDPALAARRVQQILATGAGPMAMGEVRRLLGHTQTDIAAALHVRQANVSRLEGRPNPTLGSMRALIEAMGGQLEVRARFPGLDVPIALPAAETKP